LFLCCEILGTISSPRLNNAQLLQATNATRAIEDVLEHLVEWAAAALEKASNQPVLPHVIIALNASENNIDEALWDPDVATSTVLESMSRTVYRNSTFKKYAQFWRERNRSIESVESLIRSYYSSIKVGLVADEGLLALNILR